MLDFNREDIDELRPLAMACLQSVRVFVEAESPGFIDLEASTLSIDEDLTAFDSSDADQLFFDLDMTLIPSEQRSFPIWVFVRDAPPEVSLGVWDIDGDRPIGRALLSCEACDDLRFTGLPNVVLEFLRDWAAGRYRMRLRRTFSKVIDRTVFDGSKVVWRKSSLFSRFAGGAEEIWIPSPNASRSSFTP